MYDGGQGVPQDDAEAVKWYRRAADQGNAGGQHQLGLLYDQGRGVPQDDAEAVRWYRRAADQGNAEAVQWLRQHRAHPESDASARRPLLSDNSFLQLVAAAKSIAKASNKQQLTPLIFLCAVSLLRDSTTGFAGSLAAENEDIVQREAEKQGIKLVGVDIKASDENYLCQTISDEF